MSNIWAGTIIVGNQIQSSGLQVSPLAGNAITGVPDNVLSTIVTYTAPTDKQIGQVVVSGTLYAKFEMFINATLVETRRGGPDRTMVFEFSNPLKLSAGDILDMKVIHFNTGSTGDFESTIYGG